MIDTKFTDEQLTEVEKKINSLSEKQMIDELINNKIIVDYKHTESNIGLCLNNELKKDFINYITAKIESIAKHYAKQDLQKLLHKAESYTKSEKKKYFDKIKTQTVENLNTNFINQKQIDFYILVNSTTKSIYRYYKTGIAEVLKFSAYENYLKDKYLIDLLNELFLNENKELELHEFFTLNSENDNKKICELLKNKYAGKAKGKKIALIISELTKRELLNIEYRMRTKFYNSIKSYFETDIGTDYSINKFLTENNEYNNSQHKKEIETIENEINNITKALKY